MNNSDDEKERASLERLRSNIPMLAATAAVITFLAFRIAGVTNGRSALFALVVFGIIAVMFKLREWFGVTGYLTGLFILSVIFFLINLVL